MIRIGSISVLIYTLTTTSLTCTHKFTHRLLEKAILDAVRRVTTGRTSVFIAHRLSTVMDADDILVLQDGAIAERGTHAKLIANKDGIYADMWNRQMVETVADELRDGETPETDGQEQGS